MRLSGLFMGALVVSVLTLITYSILADLGSDSVYNVAIDDQYKDTYNKLNKTNQIVDDLKGDIQNITAEKDRGFFTGVWDAFNIGKTAVFGAAALGGGAVDIVADISTNAVTDAGLGYGGYIQTFLIAALFVAIIGAIIMVILRGRFW